MPKTGTNTYTVIGDAVNEAARLADFAKAADRRIPCLSPVVDRSELAGHEHWVGLFHRIARSRINYARLGGDKHQQARCGGYTV